MHVQLGLSEMKVTISSKTEMGPKITGMTYYGARDASLGPEISYYGHLWVVVIYLWAVVSYLWAELWALVSYLRFLNVET